MDFNSATQLDCQVLIKLKDSQVLFIKDGVNLLVKTFNLLPIRVIHNCAVEQLGESHVKDCCQVVSKGVVYAEICKKTKSYHFGFGCMANLQILL